MDLAGRVSSDHHSAYLLLHCSSLVPRPSITANVVEGLVKLLHRMTSGGRLEAWHFW